ncbi:MAG: helicase-related protein [bacterium]
MQTARMSCNAAGLVDKRTDGSPKLDELQRMIEDVCVTAGRKAVVFTEWESFQRMAAERAAALDIGYVRLHGGVPTAKRGALIERFRDDPDCQLFFSTDAGGVGLNLQWADTVINLDLPWNPAVLDQRIARVHRHGQKNPVHVLLLVAEDSFETRLESVIRGKRELFEAVILPDSAVETMGTPSGCLAMARAALAVPAANGEQEEEASPGRPSKSAARPSRAAEPAGTAIDAQRSQRAAAELESGSPDRLAPPGEARGSTAGTAPEPSPDAPPEERLRELLGHRLERVVRLGSGRVVAVVDSADEVTSEAAARTNVAVLDRAAFAATQALGDDSPFAAAEVLFQRDAAPGNGRTEGRRAELLAIAHRRLHAAETLLASELPSEALAQAHAAMEAAVRALDPDAGGDTPHAARLLYEHLVPRGLFDLERAALVSRADGLARAFAELPVAPPRELVMAVVADARRIVGAKAP